MSGSLQGLPRRLVHQGTVEAVGFFLDASLYEEAEARRRILALWTPGTRVARLTRTRDGWLVLLPHPRPVRATAAPGLPLVERGQALLGAPLTVREMEAVEPARGEILFPRAGRWIREPLHGSPTEDPSSWLDVEGFAGLAPASLGEPPAVPRAVKEPPVPEVDLRKSLGGIPPADPELEGVLEELQKAGQGEGGEGAARSFGSSVRDFVRYGADLLRYGLARLLPGSSESGQGSAGLPKGEGQEPPPRAWQAIRRLFSHLVLSSPLSRLVGRRYAIYIQRMIDMFERGDIESALRHAIPLDEGLRGVPSPAALAPPRPRSSLSINPGVTRASSSTPFSLYSDLKQLYRRAFERLEAQGRFREAAFLLAEVMNAHEEAVAFLEKHGELKLAAEMAEARDLPPGLVVRQWFLAGDRERALRIARRRGAFADAVSRLERSQKIEEARLLRMHWASGLAEAGDYAAAVDVAWSVPEARRLAHQWMDRAILQGGEVGGRMLARKAGVSPEPFAPLRDAALELLESRDSERIAARLAFAESLAQGTRNPQAQTLARAALRAIARDSTVSSVHRMSTADFRKLADFAADGALRADAPALELPEKRSWIARRTLDLEIPAWDVGSLAVHDAALLPDGRLAVALGEMGVRLLSRAGRTAAELDQPAHRLVPSDHGDRAIVLARRGEVWKLSRLDFAARRSEPWCDARLDAWAEGYDGHLWYVAGPDGFVAVETSGARFDGPWGLGDLSGPILAIARSRSNASLLVAGREPEVWLYELPSFTLRQREAVPEIDAPYVWRGISPRGVTAQLWIQEEGAPQVCLETPGAVGFCFDLTPPCQVENPRIAGEWVAVPVHELGGLRVYLMHRSRSAVAGTFTLERTTRAAIRLTHESLTLADDLGRVLVIDLDHGQVVRNLRL
jgi:hypothetical protein